MHNGECKNPASAGAADPVKAVSYRLSDHFFYCTQQLNENETTYSTAIKAQNLITSIST